MRQLPGVRATSTHIDGKCCRDVPSFLLVARAGASSFAHSRLELYWRGCWQTLTHSTAEQDSLVDLFKTVGRHQLKRLPIGQLFSLKVWMVCEDPKMPKLVGNGRLDLLFAEN